MQSPLLTLFWPNSGIAKKIYTFADIKRGALFCKKHKDRLRSNPLFDQMTILLLKYAPDPGNAGVGIGVMFNYAVLPLCTAGFTKMQYIN